MENNYRRGMNPNYIEIKNLLFEDARDRKTRQVEVDKKFNELDTGLNELKAAIETNDYLTGKTSEGTLVGLLFNDAIWTFLRMKSFRRFLAMKKNGRIWEKVLHLYREVRNTKLHGLTCKKLNWISK
jgi:hypothetical protein